MKRLVLLISPEVLDKPADYRPIASRVVSAYQLLWHPALLAEASHPPTWRDLAPPPSEPEPTAVAATPPVSPADQPGESTGTPEEIEEEWFVALDSDADKARSYLESLDSPHRLFLLKEPLETAEALTSFWAGAGVELPELDTTLVRDYYALGFARLGLEILLHHMGHSNELSRLMFWDDVQRGAEKLVEGEVAAAGDHLQAAFDMLQAARQSVYPASISLLDFSLWDGIWSVDDAQQRVSRRSALNLILNGEELEALAESNRPMLELIDRELTQGSFEVLSGSYDSRPWGLIGPESRIWQLQQTFDAFDLHLRREIDCFGARQGTLVPDLPMLLQKFHFRYAMHGSFDGSRFPLFKDPKIYWAAPDGSSIESHTRRPLDGSDESLGLLFAARLGRSLMEDRAATLGIVHWSSMSSPWMKWLLAVQQRANVFGRFELFSDFFINSMMVEKTVHTYVDEYASGYLPSALRRGEDDPIGQWMRGDLLRGLHDSTAAIEAMIRIVSPNDPLPERAVPREQQVEKGQVDEATIRADQQSALKRLAELLLAESPASPGYLLVNPCAHPRRATVQLPADLSFLPVVTPIRGVQPSIEGPESTAVVVDLPGWGYVWIPKTAAGLTASPSSSSAKPPAKATSKGNDDATIVKGRHLRNEFIDVEIDAKSGGIRGIRPARSNYNRLAQQIVAGVPSTMACEETITRTNGHVMGEIETRGHVRLSEDRSPLCRFRQVVRVWKGRPHAEVFITLSDVETLGHDPNRDYIACRWGWPDEKAELSSACGICLQSNPSAWIETTSRLRLRERNLLTEILPCGVPFHRRGEGRTLDSLLVVRGESTRTFRFDIALDLAHGWTAVYDQLWPLGVTEVEHGPPPRGATGWVAKLKPVDVVCTRIAPENPPAVGHSAGYSGGSWQNMAAVRMHFVESLGESVRAELRFCRDPDEAQLVNARGQLIFDLGFSEEMATVDLAPHEIQAIRLCFEEKVEEADAEAAGSPSIESGESGDATESDSG